MPIGDTKFLFVFGFEDPIEYQGNKRDGTDFESSRAVWIEATEEEAAIGWGRQIAENYVRQLFENAESSGYNWHDANFAHWIEERPADRWLPEQLDKLPVVPSGQFPELEDLDNLPSQENRTSEQGVEPDAGHAPE